MAHAVRNRLVHRWLATQRTYDERHVKRVYHLSSEFLTGRSLADWKPARTILGVPYDSFIVGHKTDTVNTLRLWAARATRDLDLNYFNDGNFTRAAEEKIDSENISKILYPDDHTEGGKSLRLKQEYFSVTCSIGDIVCNFSEDRPD